MLQGYIARKWGDKMFEEDIAKVVKKRAFWGAIIMALPLFGVEWIVFTIILWSMYSKLCEKVGVNLKFSTIIVGFIVNIIIAIAIDALFALLPLLGWLGTGFLVYLQFYLSGKAYIETLRKVYPNQTNPNIKAQISQQDYSDKFLTTSVNNETTSDAYNSSKIPVMLFFYASWCNICKTEVPLVDDIEREYNGRINVKKVDVDTNHGLVAKYGIENVPTFLFFMPGCDQYKDIVVGNTTNGILKQKLNDLLYKPTTEHQLMERLRVGGITYEEHEHQLKQIKKDDETENMTKLMELRDAGLISQEEFEEQVSKI